MLDLAWASLMTRVAMLWIRLEEGAELEETHAHTHWYTP